MAKVNVKISRVYMFDTNNRQVVVDKFPGRIPMTEARKHAKTCGMKFTHKVETTHVLDIDDMTLLQLVPGGSNLDREYIS